MSNNKYQIYVDCGFSKLRACAFHKTVLNKKFHVESNFLFDHKEISIEVQKIVTFLEKNTSEYIDSINLMLDSPKMLSIGISISKKIDGLQLEQDDIQFLVQEAKQQILEYYKNENIIHIIINNYKINGSDYDYLPLNTKCNFIALDILFICLPEEIIKYYKNIFYKFDISINQIICSSYVKAINYKDNFSSYKNLSFIDVGFNKTSITLYVNNKIVSLDVLPIGANHITKDISKILKIDLKQAENLKLNFDKDKNLSKDENFSLNLAKKIIFARTEEILEMSAQSIKLNFIKTNNFRTILTGDGSKILDNRYKDQISFESDIDFLEETAEDICQSGFKFEAGSNKQEVEIIPKKLIKQGFFEKFFHFFN